MEVYSLISWSFIYILVKEIQADNIVLDGKNWTLYGENGYKGPGQVPGGVYTDLIRNQEIGDPYFRFNDANYAWLSLLKWTYSTHFQASSQLLEKDNINLVILGVDTVSLVTLNGRPVGHTDNMFLKYTWDVKNLLQEGANILEVTLESSVTAAERLASSYPYTVPPNCPPDDQQGQCHVNFLRMEQCAFSWDWGPSFPAGGIWKSVYIEASDYPALEDLMVVPYLDSKSSTWHINITVCTGATQVRAAFSGNLTAEIKELNVFETFPVQFDGNHLCSSKNVTLSEAVELWWPNGIGAQKLYTIFVTLTSGTKNVSSGTRTFGFRQVELVQEPVSSNPADGLTFLFRINGREVFMKGSNWIPADSFQERISEDYLRSLLGSARDAHMNMLRVWGGGVYESDTFYKIADEYGIMIWQDFMFACAMYPTDVTYLENVKKEIIHQIHRLIHHPSIAVWAGSNENEAALRDNWYNTNPQYSLYYADYVTLYIKTIREVVSREDSSRPFVASSPSNGVQSEQQGWVASDPYSQYYGDVHYYNYGMDGWNPILYPVPRFMSEYGFQSWPSFSNIEPVSLAQDWDLNSSFVRHRQHHPDGNSQLIQEVSMHLKLPTASNSTQYFIDFMYLTQINQAMSIKTESEVYIRSQSKVVEGRGRTMGALYWQLNDIWQAPTWSSLEYGGKWKMLHYFAKNFFSPRIVSAYLNSSTVTVYYIQTNTSNGGRPLKDDLQNKILKTLPKKQKLTIQMTLYSWDNTTPLKSWNYIVPQTNESAVKVVSLTLSDLLSQGQCPDRKKCFLYFHVPEAADIPANYLFLSNFTDVQGLKKPEYKVTVLKQDKRTFQIELRANHIAAFVWLDVGNITGRFSDNGLLLISPVKLLFHAWQDIDISVINDNLKVTSLMDIY